MKNILLVLVMGLLAASDALAQINLVSTGYPSSVLGTDSLKETASSSAFPSLTAGTNATWDLSTVTDTTPVFFAYRVPTATYQFADSNTYALGTYSYKGNVQSSITSSDLLQYGINVFQANYSLAGVTSTTDTLFIPTQQDTFHSAQRIVIAFPATYHTSWSSVYTANFSFALSIAFAGLSYAPGITRTYTSEKDSVTGWGKMRVKDASGSPSAYFNVLQVQSVTTSIDSFFVNGMPALSTLLMALGLTQGQKDTVYEQNYYRVGEVTPLAQVEFRDAAFTQPYHATTHAERIYANAVPSISSQSGVKVYPNPVTAGSDVTVSLPALGGDWSYELIDINGKKVTAGTLQSSGANASIGLPSVLVAGIYYLKVNNNGSQVSITPVDVAR